MSADPATARPDLVLEVCELALDREPEDRDTWLTQTYGEDPLLVGAVRRLLARDTASRALLPTEAPDYGSAFAGVNAPPERIGAYRLLELLGEGGMGAVYRAERDDGLFEHIVAVKLISSQRLDARSAERFALERRALARLTHPNIARLLDGGVTPQGSPYILMDYVDGIAIADHVTRRDLSAREVVELLIQVCDAVAEAHRKLVIHGDLKPSNILVSEGGPGHPDQARLLDFGVARLMDIAEDQQPRSPVTAAYADPARSRGEPPTTADDVFALGVVLRELVSRRGPTLGDGPERTLPRDLRAIADKAAAPAPADRYGSVDALAEDLRRWLRKDPVTARHAGAAYVAGRFFARRPRISIAAALAVVALAGTAAVTTAMYFHAETERREADHRFGQARGMARYMLFDLFDQLNRTPGTISIRRDLVDTSRRYLRDLATSPRASTELKADAAMGYLRLAAVLSLSGSGNLGEREQAKAMLRQAERVMATPPADAERSAPWMHARGRLELSQGFEIMVQGAGAKTAEPRLKAAVATLRKAAALDPRDPEILADLWETRLSLADLRESENDHHEALAILREELAAYPLRSRVMALDEKTPLLLARTYKGIGNVRYDMGDKPGSIGEYARAVSILESENARRPDRSRTIIELMDGWWNLAGSLDETKQSGAALTLLDKALAAGRARMMVDPENDNLRRQTNLVQLDRASLLARLGRRSEALVDARRTMEAWRAGAEAHPNDVLALRGYLTALRPFADVEKTVGMKAQACADYRAVQSKWAAYERRFGLSPRLRDIELKIIANEIAKCG